MLRCAVWDSFFLDEPMPGADFMEARAAQVQDERESL
jgi:virulence-associated protein VagC